MAVNAGSSRTGEWFCSPTPGRPYVRSLYTFEEESRTSDRIVRFTSGIAVGVALSAACQNTARGVERTPRNTAEARTWKKTREVSSRGLKATAGIKEQAASGAAAERVAIAPRPRPGRGAAQSVPRLHARQRDQLVDQTALIDATTSTMRAH